MKKKVIGILLLIAMVVMAACGGEDANQSSNEGNGDQEVEANGSDSQDETIELNFSTVSVPGDAHTEGLYVFEEVVEELSEGRIEVEIHHSGSLYAQGNDEQAVMRGNLEMTYVSANLASEHLPEASMFTAGYMFKDYDHMTGVLNGDIGQDLFDKVAEVSGYRPLGAYYLGSRQLNYRDIGREIYTPQDLNGVLLRMPDSPSWLFLGDALGANPTPLAFGELYTALNTGTVDAQDNPLPTVVNANFDEVTDYVSLTYHLVDSTWPAINEDFWQSLDEDLQTIILQGIEEARKYVDETNIVAEEDLIDQLKESGLTVIEPDREAFMTTVQDAYLNNEDMTSTWDMDLYDEIQALIE
ncbi:DctP family TRAP transporter solute-binding subunit [Halalkalibacter sp. AB-rgal2]|uniref:DctP family TRAP transporter solute-binding subunit n=1 Tax=Halalkalibacter sp. AB-rgal2 TaxID=3242695 RepID=UPI00359CF56B